MNKNHEIKVKTSKANGALIASFIKFIKTALKIKKKNATIHASA